jgi:phosphoglycolate phosphatase
MKLDSVVFDLDGTLWDTTPACATAWNRVLDRNRITYRPIRDVDVRKVTGRPHDDCIRETFGDLPPETVQLLIRETATEDNVEIERSGGVLYDGVAEGLRQLADSLPLYIVSNCQSGYIDTFFRQTGLEHCFRDSECFGDTGMPKADNLRLLIERNRLKAPVMVGDTDGDRDAALQNGVPFFFVSYGFGKLEGEREYRSFPELVRALLG